MPMSLRTRFTSTCAAVIVTPSSSTVPALGLSSRLRQRSRVDLPEPDGPITHTTSRAWTARSTPFSTSVWPNDLRSPAARRITGAVVMAPTAPRRLLAVALEARRAEALVDRGHGGALGRLPAETL